MSQQTRAASQAQSGDARHQLQRLYREIGISAVAAAVAQVRRPEPVREAKRDMPAWMREDVAA